MPILVKQKINARFAAVETLRPVANQAWPTAALMTMVNSGQLKGETGTRTAPTVAAWFQQVNGTN